ncbi:MAG: hypothetical protein ABJL67_05825 [Sulfitobacter sp.]
MIKQRTIAISMAAMALTACAHNGFQAQAPTRAQTSPLLSYDVIDQDTRRDRFLKKFKRRANTDFTTYEDQVRPDAPSSAGLVTVEETFSSRASISLL